MRGSLLRWPLHPWILIANRRLRLAFRAASWLTSGIDVRQRIFINGFREMSAIAYDRLDVLAVGPHPDDLEITCGGTLAKLVRQGYRVGIVDLTSGEPTPRGSEELRAAEAEAARQVLGVPLRLNAGLPNRELMDVPANRYVLATLFRRLRPTVVIAVAGRTPAASPDHHQAHLLIEAARFWSQLTKWDDRFGGTPPHRVPHLVYAPFPFDAEVRHWHSTFVIDITRHVRAEDGGGALLRLAVRRGTLRQGEPFRQRPRHFDRQSLRLSLTASCSHCRIRSAPATCMHWYTAARECRHRRRCRKIRHSPSERAFDSQGVKE